MSAKYCQIMTTNVHSLPYIAILIIEAETVQGQKWKHWNRFGSVYKVGNARVNFSKHSLNKYMVITLEDGAFELLL